jgi:putative membrane protein
MARVIAAALHLLALGLGLGAVLTRGNTLREPITTQSLNRAFRADTLWGVAAALWLATGLWRLFGELEKTRSYYLANSLFVLKIALFVLVLILEAWPMMTLIRWRSVLRRGASPDTFVTVAAANRLATLSHVEALVIIVMIFVAAAMARGFGM